MDLFGFCSETLRPGEEVVVSLQKGITLYDGEDKYKVIFTGLHKLDNGMKEITNGNICDF